MIASVHPHTNTVANIYNLEENHAFVQNKYWKAVLRRKDARLWVLRAVRAISTSRSRSTLSLQPHDVQAVQTEIGFFEFFHLLYRKASNRTISPWHDISLFSEINDVGNADCFNFINEIKR